MDAQSHKLELIQWLISLNDSQTIQKLISLKNSTSNRISIEQYNDEIEQAEQRIVSGKSVSDSDLDGQIEKWA